MAKTAFLSVFSPPIAPIFTFWPKNEVSGGGPPPSGGAKRGVRGGDPPPGGQKWCPELIGRVVTGTSHTCTPQNDTPTLHSAHDLYPLTPYFIDGSVSTSARWYTPHLNGYTLTFAPWSDFNSQALATRGVGCADGGGVTDPPRHPPPGGPPVARRGVGGVGGHPPDGTWGYVGAQSTPHNLTPRHLAVKLLPC